MTLLVFILILSALVLVHEFGHFLMARRVGVYVEEFGMGIPPRVFGKRIGETLYSLNLLPLGGFVRLLGEDVSSEDADINTLRSNPRSFLAKSPLKRSLIIVAGVFMNFLLASILFYIVLFSNSFKTFQLPILIDHKFKFGSLTYYNTVIASVSEDSNIPDTVSLGDVIVSVNNVSVNSVDDIHAVLRANGDDVVRVTLLRGPKLDQTYTVNVTPIIKNDMPMLGVYLAESAVISYASTFEKLFAGFLHSFNVLDYSIHVFGSLIKVAFVSRDMTPVSSTVSGPVGIYNILDVIMSSSMGSMFFILLDFVAVMSVNLAFINILPFPALDGGRLLFILIEMVRKRPVSPKLEARFHQIGMALLFGLFIAITIKDLAI